MFLQAQTGENMHVMFQVCFVESVPLPYAIIHTIIHSIRLFVLWSKLIRNHVHLIEGYRHTVAYEYLGSGLATIHGNFECRVCTANTEYIE